MSSATKGLIAAQVFLFAILNNATAQFQQSGYEVGINVGTLVYQGELTPRFYGYTKSLKPAIGLYADKSVSSYFTLRGNLVFGKIIADESKYASPEWRQYRGLKFATNVTELTATLVFNPFGEGNEFNYRRLNPYVFAGAGIAFLKVKRDWSDYNTNYFDAKSTTSIALGADTVHALPKAVAVLPVGIGIKYILSPRLAFDAQATWRLTSSDYIDGFKYPSEKNNRDSYYGISVGISYKLGNNRYKCPSVK